MHILLAEDDEMVRRCTRAILEIEGHTVFEAVDGQEAIRMFDEDPDNFDLILTDYCMPNATGCELAKHVRSKSCCPVILATGYAKSFPPEEAAKCGVTEYLTKPLAAEKITSMVAGYSNLRSLEAPRECTESTGNRQFV